MESKISHATTAAQATAKPATPQTPEAPQAEQGRGFLTAQEIRDLQNQAREAARAQIARQGENGRPPRQITIRGPDGTETVVGVPSDFAKNMIPPQAVDISIAFFVMVAAIIIGLPLARAFARRMDRSTARAPIAPELSAQLTQINQAVDAIALEVERISEGQRYTTRLLAEQRDPMHQTLPARSDT